MTLKRTVYRLLLLVALVAAIPSTCWGQDQGEELTPDNQQNAQQQTATCGANTAPTIGESHSYPKASARRGPQGYTGAQGPQGPPGPPGVRPEELDALTKASKQNSEDIKQLEGMQMKGLRPFRENASRRFSKLDGEVISLFNTTRENTENIGNLTTQMKGFSDRLKTAEGNQATFAKQIGELRGDTDNNTTSASRHTIALVILGLSVVLLIAAAVKTRGTIATPIPGPGY